MRKSPFLFAIYTFSFVFLISSCSIEKRLYQPGFNVDWRIKPNSNANNTVEKNKNYLNSHSSEKDFSTELSNADLGISTNSIADNSSLAQNENINSNSKSITFSHIASNTPIIENKPLNKSDATKLDIPIRAENKVLANASKKILKANIRALKSSAETQGSVALRAIGWIFLALGIIILIFASILIGALLMLLGLAFVIGGSKSSSDSKVQKNKSDSNYIDVVYLKNGGILRGMIIEQIPNVQLKIQTRDGNVFVYKIDEIEKITKEIEDRN